MSNDPLVQYFNQAEAIVMKGGLLVSTPTKSNSKIPANVEIKENGERPVKRKRKVEDLLVQPEERTTGDSSKKSRSRKTPKR